MRKLLFLLSIILIACVAYWLFKLSMDDRDRKVFTKFTGISKFDVIADVREDRYFCMTTHVSRAEKRKFLDSHNFRSPPVDLRGNIDAIKLHHIKVDNYVYYLEDVGHGYLGYALYLVSNTDDTVIMYINYAD
jgi:hypothetical protein